MVRPMRSDGAAIGETGVSQHWRSQHASDPLKLAGLITIGSSPCHSHDCHLLQVSGKLRTPLGKSVRTALSAFQSGTSLCFVSAAAVGQKFRRTDGDSWILESRRVGYPRRLRRTSMYPACTGETDEAKLVPLCAGLPKPSRKK